MLRTESDLDRFAAGPKVAATFWPSLTTKVIAYQAYRPCLITKRAAKLREQIEAASHI
jgi:hypothetical protein